MSVNLQVIPSLISDVLALRISAFKMSCDGFGFV